MLAMPSWQLHRKRPLRGCRTTRSCHYFAAIGDEKSGETHSSSGRPEQGADGEWGEVFSDAGASMYHEAPGLKPFFPLNPVRIQGFSGEFGRGGSRFFFCPGFVFLLVEPPRFRAVLQPCHQFSRLLHLGHPAHIAACPKALRYLPPRRLSCS